MRLKEVMGGGGQMNAKLKSNRRSARMSSKAWRVEGGGGSSWCGSFVMYIKFTKSLFI